MSYLLLIISVLVGVLLVFFIKPGKKSVRLLLAFSGAYLLSITILHLLPEIFTNEDNHVHGSLSGSKLLGILILAGILIQSILESFSKGIEHGHIHTNDKDKHHFPWMIFVSLCIHAFSEGLPIHEHSENNLLWAIIIHKIPVSIVLTTLFLHSKLSLKRIIIALSFFALMSPFGKLLGNNAPLLINHHSEITAFIIGVFLHISTVILFESTENHKFNIKKFTAIFLGVLLAIFTS